MVYSSLYHKSLTDQLTDRGMHLHTELISLVNPSSFCILQISFPLINEHKKAKKKKYVNSGVLYLSSFTVR